MAVEKISTITSSQAIEKGKKRNKPGILKTLKTEAFMTFGFPRIERINKNTPVDFNEGFDDSFKQAVRENDLIVLVSSHDSLFNGHSLSLVTEQLTHLARLSLNDQEGFAGFFIPVASSLATGDQSYFDRRAYEKSEPVLNKRHLYTTPHTRDKDRKQYNTEPNRSDYMKSLVYATTHKFGIAVFAEGNMGNGGGMRKLEDDVLPFIMGLAQRHGRNTTLIPIGTSGDKVLPPHKPPTIAAWKAGFWLGNPRLAYINVGVPIRSPELNELALSENEYRIEQFNSYMGAKIAELLPEEKRGIYGNQSILEPGVVKSLGEILTP